MGRAGTAPHPSRGRDVGSLSHLQRTLGRRPLVGAGAHELHRPARWIHAHRRPCTTASTASGTPFSEPRSAPSAVASCASRSIAPVWLAVYAAERSSTDVSDLGAGSTLARDHSRRHALPAGPLQHLHGVGLRALVAQQDQPLAAGRARAVQHRIHRLHRPRLHARGAQEPGADVGRMPAGAGADQEQAPPRSRSAAASTPVASASMPRSCSGWDCIVSLMKLTSTLPSIGSGSIARYWMRGCQPASRVRRDRAARRRLRWAERGHDRVRAAPVFASTFVTAHAPAGRGRSAGDRRDRA